MPEIKNPAVRDFLRFALSDRGQKWLTEAIVPNKTGARCHDDETGYPAACDEPATAAIVHRKTERQGAKVTALGHAVHGASRAKEESHAAYERAADARHAALVRASDLKPLAKSLEKQVSALNKAMNKSKLAGPDVEAWKAAKDKLDGVKDQLRDAGHDLHNAKAEEKSALKDLSRAIRDHAKLHRRHVDAHVKKNKEAADVRQDVNRNADRDAEAGKARTQAAKEKADAAAAKAKAKQDAADAKARAKAEKAAQPKPKRVKPEGTPGIIRHTRGHHGEDGSFTPDPKGDGSGYEVNGKGFRTLTAAKAYARGEGRVKAGTSQEMPAETPIATPALPEPSVEFTPTSGTPELPAAPAPTAPKEVEPGFTGIDSLGRKWQDGELVAATPDGPAANAPTFPPDAAPAARPAQTPAGEERPAEGAEAGRETAATKKPWRMTPDEYRQHQKGILLRDFGVDDATADRMASLPSKATDHFRAIQAAAGAGEKIPDEVLDALSQGQRDRILKDYPDAHDGYLPPAQRNAAPAQPLPGGGDSREPHEKAWAERRKEITRGETKLPTPKEWQALKAKHQSQIQAAIAAGKKVPAEVLADYPELGDSSSPTTPAKPGKVGPDELRAMRMRLRELVDNPQRATPDELAAFAAQVGGLKKADALAVAQYLGAGKLATTDAALAFVRQKIADIANAGRKKAEVPTQAAPVVTPAPSAAPAPVTGKPSLADAARAVQHLDRQRGGHGIIQDDALGAALGLSGAELEELIDQGQRKGLWSPTGDLGDLSLYPDRVAKATAGSAWEPRKNTYQPTGADHAKLASALQQLNAARGNHNFVSLVDLRKSLGMSRDQFDATIHDLRKKGVISLAAAEGRHGITSQEQADGIREDGALLLYAQAKDAGKVAELAGSHLAVPDENKNSKKILTPDPVSDIVSPGAKENVTGGTTMKTEYREGEARPEAPEGYHYQQVVRDNPGNDVREFHSVYRLVRTATPALADAKAKVRELVGSPWSHPGGQKIQGAIPADVSGDVYEYGAGDNHRRYKFAEDGVWAQLVSTNYETAGQPVSYKLPLTPAQSADLRSALETAFPTAKKAPPAQPDAGARQTQAGQGGGATADFAKHSRGSAEAAATMAKRLADSGLSVRGEAKEVVTGGGPKTPGSVVWESDGPHVVVWSATHRDEEGVRTTRTVTVPVNPDDSVPASKQAEIAHLRAKISSRVAGPDDDRMRGAYEDESRRLDNRLRSLEGRPSVEEEQATRKAAEIEAEKTAPFSSRLSKAAARFKGGHADLAKAAGMTEDRYLAIRMGPVDADYDRMPPVKPTPEEMSRLESVLGHFGGWRDYDDAHIASEQAEYDAMKEQSQASAPATPEPEPEEPEEVEVTGNTYPHKDSIKKIPGAKFRGGKWYIPADQTHRLHRKLGYR